MVTKLWWMVNKAVVDGYKAVVDGDALDRHAAKRSLFLSLSLHKLDIPSIPRNKIYTPTHLQ